MQQNKLEICKTILIINWEKCKEFYKIKMVKFKKQICRSKIGKANLTIVRERVKD